MVLHGNSVFVDESLQPFPDQWTYLAGVDRLEFSLVNALYRGADMERLDSGVVMERLQSESLLLLWVLLILFAIVWIYSVVDAFWNGKKIENQVESDIL